MRIQKYMSECGVCSRRKAEELVKEGKVYINGKKAEIGNPVEEGDEVVVNGKKIKKEEYVYYLLNKPIGYICTNDEQFGRDKAIDLIKEKKRIVTAGRLDMYTSGAIIVTNDGELINVLTHPRHEIEKEYYVTVKGEVPKEKIAKLVKGVEIDNQGKRYKTGKSKVKILGYSKEKNQTRISITIHEGKNRQVRKMFKEIGLSVIALHRNKIGFLDVKNLKPGKYIKLEKNVVKRLLNI